MPVVTDRDLVVPPIAWPTTNSNQKFVDPTFGLDTTIAWKPSDFGGKAVYTEYSQQPSFNRDSTRMWFSVEGGGVYTCTWHAANMTRGAAVELPGARAYTVWWSGLDPNLIYYINSAGTGLYKKDVSSNAAPVLVFNFGNYFNNNGLSGAEAFQGFLAYDNDDYYSGVITHPGGQHLNQWYLMSLKNTPAIIKRSTITDTDGAATAGVNEAQITPDGRFMYLASHATGSYRNEVQQYYRVATDELFNFGERFTVGANYNMPFGHNILDNAGVIGEDQNGNHVRFVPWTVFETANTIAQRITNARNSAQLVFSAEYNVQVGGRNVNVGQHFARIKKANPSDPVKFALSHYDHRKPSEKAGYNPGGKERGEQGDYDPTYDETVIVAINSPNGVHPIQRSFKHHVLQHNPDGGEYNYLALPRTNVSPDGQFAVANTTFDVDNGKTGIVVVRLGAGAAVEPPPPPPVVVRRVYTWENGLVEG